MSHFEQFAGAIQADIVIMQPIGDNIILTFRAFMKNKLTQQLPAFLLFGIALALLLGLFVVFAYVLFWGIILGALLWGFAFIFSYFQTPKTHKKGRIINYDEFK